LNILQKPQKLRQMLEQHGEVGRLYLAPEGVLDVAGIALNPVQLVPPLLCSFGVAVGDVTSENELCCHLSADPGLRRKRKQQGGNSGKNFTEGWVEFEDKQIAKQVWGKRVDGCAAICVHAVFHTFDSCKMFLLLLAETACRHGCGNSSQTACLAVILLGFPLHYGMRRWPPC
jgi:hypothetical protein